MHPLHERLVGRSTLRFDRELGESQWWSPVQVRDLQTSKLNRLFAHVREHVPYYRDRLPVVSNGRKDGDPWAVLKQLPLISKEEIRRAGEAIIWRDSPGGLTQRSTGGSTGEPLTFFLDRRREAYDQAARMRTHRWFGVQMGDCEVLLWGSPIEWCRTDRAKSLRDRLFQQHLLNAFAMSPTRMDSFLRKWDKLRPVSLFGYPSSIALFVQHAQARNRSLDTSRLKAVFVTGEVCYPHDRSTIETYFRAPVADGYGSREAGFIAHQCPEGGMHITAENVIVEIVEYGHAVPQGETGEIVVTHLDAYGMPFIRYRTGDQGRLIAGRCRCGRGLPLMDVVQGRSTDFLVLPDGTIKHALSIIYPLREMEAVGRFRVTQEQNLAVTVEVVAAASKPRPSIQLVHQKLRPVVGPEIALDVRFVDGIESASSGKYRYVISHARRRSEAYAP